MEQGPHRRLSALIAAVDELADGTHDDGPVDPAELVDLVRQIDRLHGVLAHDVARFDTAEGHRADGAPTAASWLRHHLQMGVAEAANSVRTGRAMRDLLQVSEAWVAGEMPSAHAHHIGRASKTNPEAMAEIEDVLVEQAARLDADAFGRLVRHALDLADPDRGADRARRAHEERRAHIHQVGSQEVLTGAFDLGDGGWVRRALECFAEDLFRADAGVEPLDRRSSQQRNADALVEICRTALGARGQRSGARLAPRVTAIVDDDTLAGEQADDLVVALREWLPGPDGSPPRRRCERDDGTPLPQPVAERLACDAGFQRVVTAGRRLLDLGREVRLASRAQRDALIVRDGGCRFPGCDRPHWWCEAHHVVPFDDGGLTSLDNLVLLCGHHHHLLHEGGYRARGDPQLAPIRFFRPDGTLISPIPRRAHAPPGRAA